MPVNNSDYLLQQILIQNQNQNDKLSGIREILADSLKELKKDSSGGNGNPPGGVPSGGGNGGRGDRGRGQPKKLPFGDLFKNLRSELMSAGSTMLSSSGNVSNVVNSLGMSAVNVAGSLGKAIPAIGGVTTAFTMVAEAGMAVYNYLNAQLDMYNRLSSAGVNLTDGMVSFRKNATAAYMSVDEFSAVVSKNSQSVMILNSLYGDGVGKFGSLLGSVQKAQDQLGLYGVSQQTLTDLTSRNIKFQKLFNTNQAMNDIQQTNSTINFVQSMVKLSKTVGESVDTLLNKVQSFDKNINTRQMSVGLQNRFKFDQKTASKVTASFNEALAGFGDAGQVLQDLLGHRNTFGGGVPEELNRYIVQQIADLEDEMASSGTSDSDAIRKQLRNFYKQNRAQIETEMQNAVLDGNTAVSSFLNNFASAAEAMDETEKTSKPVFEGYINKFNMWVTDTFTKPFNDLYEGTVTYIGKSIEQNKSLGEIFITLSSAAAKELFGSLLDYVLKIPESMLEFVAGDSPYVQQIMGSMKDFLLNLIFLPKQIFKILLDLLSGNIGQLKTDFFDLIHQIFDPLKNMFGGAAKLIKSLDFSKMFENMLNGIKDIGKFFGKVRSWFDDDDEEKPEEQKKPETPQQQPQINNNANQTNQEIITGMTEQMRKQPPVEITPKITKPERIQEAQDEQKQQQTAAAVPPPVNYDEAILSVLNRLNDAYEQANVLNTQSANYLRTISENTQGERNS